MNLLVSFCNVKTPGMPAIGLLDLAAGRLRIPELPADWASCTGVCGLASTSRWIYTAYQGWVPPATEASQPVPVLLTFDRTTLALRSHHLFREVRDVHSICATDDELFIVSTGTDEIVRLPVRDGQVLAEEVLWRPDPSLPRSDNYHLNGLCAWKGDLVVSGFGRRTGPRWGSATDGMIFNVTRREAIVTGINHPHSVLPLGDDVLVYCESSRMALDAYPTQRRRCLDGYTRGLCLAGGKLYAGTSVGRQLSRSSGQINNPAESGAPDGRCAIYQIDPNTFDVEAVFELTAHAHEIYDLLPVDDVTRWRFIPDLAWRDNAAQILMAKVDERTRWAKQRGEEVAVRDAAIGELRAELATLRDRLSRAERTRDEAVQAIREVTLRRDALTSKAEMTCLRANQLKTATDSLADEVWYQGSINRIQELVGHVLPPSSTVAVVSRGDTRLLELGDHRAIHFPQDDDGGYIGRHPDDDADAIARLEVARDRGAEYLLVPSYDLWLLDDYPAFGRHVKTSYPLVREQAEACMIFNLRPVAS